MLAEADGNIITLVKQAVSYEIQDNKNNKSIGFLHISNERA